MTIPVLPPLEADNNIPKNVIRLRKLSQNLGYNLSTIKNAIREGKIPTTKVGKKEPAIEISYIPKLKALIESQSTVQTKAGVRNARKARKNKVDENVTVSIRDRASAPFQTILFIGPTNSGKTYHGLEELCADYEQHPEETHVYCGPLRLLAYEVYQKLVLKYGEDKVGFITGEEAINPDAKLLACTVEMAPDEGYSMLIDEAHWLTDSNRGHVWSRILVGGKYKNLYVITAAEATPIVEKLTEDSHHREHRVFARKTPLRFAGKINLKDIEPRTAVVCFSRKSVYIIARELEKLGKKVGVLYGALPLKVRKKQIEDYLNGVYDIMVTTDVIGHGINLPIDNVVFSQTDKFDGTEVRPLRIWEAAQIAGRAGRFGLSKEGKVYLAAGLPWFNADADLIKHASLAAGGKEPTDLIIDRALIAPRLSDLGIKDLPAKEAMMTLLPALESWKVQATRLLTDRTLEASPLATIMQNTEEVLTTLSCPRTPWNPNTTNSFEHDQKTLELIEEVDITEIWQLISGPFDVRNGVINKLSIWLSKDDRDESNYLTNFYKSRIGTPLNRMSAAQTNYNDIETLENIVACLAEIKMGMTMFGQPENDTFWLGTLSQEELFNDEEIANQLIMDVLKSSIKKSTFGNCTKCGAATKPWFQYCDNCFEHSRWES